MKLIDEIAIAYANNKGGGLPLTAKEYCNALALWVQKHINEDKELTVNTLYELLTGTDTITLYNNGQKIEIHLNAEVLADIERSLKFPVSRPTETELVGVDSLGQQVMIPRSQVGGKIYQHNVRIQFYRDDIGSEMEREFFDFQFPSSSANKIEGTFDNSTSAFSLIPDNKYLGGWGDYANSEFGGDGIIIKTQNLFYAMGYSVTRLNINTYITFIADLNSLSGDPITRIVVTDDVKEI